ncbi:TonB-dependent receptor [Synoicihabitans lomoniglobus]|uniref:TonB-dependent receptor n=1 Tax=Synoicihabitans lomoniglobus TaxID=2909285 RepID=A0AAF0CMU2_9BACT|nr:TonB-dependent receptor [Opitutaceae bacterium LMO-M01]WED64638.1 TonB-dependent receptor [Opitutaceae bacterium LMO-M01]
MKRVLLTLTLALGTVASLFAQSAGVLSGRVTDVATNLALGGVRVKVDGTAHETYTLSNGSYSIAALEPGTYTVSFSYVGYDGVSETAAVAPTGITRLDMQFGENAIEMDAFVIEGAMVGTARAINQQRAAATLSNIVASDEIGGFADQNAAEALQRIPGVSLYRDQGEGRYIVLRGLNFNFTSVKVNGGSFAGADLGDRATALDVVPTDALASIEVTKVPTPDMDGEGLGGRVNIKTKSAFDSDGVDANFRAQGQYSALTGEYSPKINGMFSTRFGDDNQFGFLIAPTWQVRSFGSVNVETGGDWTDEESPQDGEDYYFIEELQYRDYIVERERYGVNLALEAKPDDASYYYLRAGYNNFTDTEDRHRTVIALEDGDIDALNGSGATVTSEEDDGEYEKMYSRELRMREKEQEVFSVVTGLEKRLGLWELKAQLGYTLGREQRPDEISVAYEPTDEFAKTFTYTVNTPYDVTLAQTAGPSILDAGSYEFDKMEVANESGDEEEFDLGVDIRRDLETSFPAFVKFGGLHRSKEKTSEVELWEYEDGPAIIQSLSGANIGAGDYPFLAVPRISPDAFRDAYYNQVGSFDSERNFEDSEFDDWVINEDVTAAYLMASGTFNRLNVIAGSRVERTKFDTTGRQITFDEDGDPVGSTPISASRSYTNWLPGVFLRYDLSDQLVLRASWSNSIARPSFGDSAFRRNVNNEDEEVTVGNPFLEELKGTNWDASVEYYLPSLGMLSASVFKKEIENFAYETEIAADPTYPGYEITSFENGSEGDITGLELAYQQQFRFLPGAFSGLGFMANATFLDSDATYPTRPGEQIPFVGQSNTTANFALTYDKGPLFARLAMNYRTARLREDETIGGDVTEDLYVDDFAQLDLTVRYELNDNWELFGEWINITDEPFRVYLDSDNGQGKRLGQIEIYDWSANFGVRWKL